jgi:two-component system phosphate regulon sensor histidine kinase PhoR
MASMTRNRRWIWITLSVVLAAILGVMAASYTATIVSDYRKMLQIAAEFERPKLPQSPTITLTLGSIGFAASILGVMIFLFRLLREMKLNQIQSEFIARVSHELKTPLATIELTADLLRTQEQESHESSPSVLPALDDERRKLWRSHDEELDRLKRQVHSLLETARWQVSPPRVQRTRIRLKDWLTSQAPRWHEILGNHATISMEVDQLDFEIDADTDKLELIFNNLVENARKFARPESDGPTLRVRGGPISDSEWEIEVEDSGWGFPKELSKRLFQRFYRAPHGAPYAIAGTGLGLHLSLAAAQAMKIKLSARSEGVGRGAVFKLEGKQA